MRLSEAIRKGSNGLKQISGLMSRGPGTGCVLEAARIGAGLETTAFIHPVLMAVFHEFMSLRLTTCPGEGCIFPGCFGVLVHLNDGHNWTFDQIADWVQAEEAIHGLGEQVEEKPADQRSAAPAKEPALAG